MCVRAVCVRADCVPARQPRWNCDARGAHARGRDKEGRKRNTLNTERSLAGAVSVAGLLRPGIAWAGLRAASLRPNSHRQQRRTLSDLRATAAGAQTFVIELSTS